MPRTEVDDNSFAGKGYTRVDDTPRHEIFTLVDGTRPFTGTVGGIDPVLSPDLATKEYVDTNIGVDVDYFFGNTASDIGGIYYDMTDADLGGSESTLSTGPLGTGDDQALVNFATIAGVPGIKSLRAGIHGVHVHAEKTGGTKPVILYAEIYTRTSGGSETLIATTEVSGLVTSKSDFTLHATVAGDITIDDTDRIVVKWYANVGGQGSNATVALYSEGNTSSHFTLPTTSDVLSHVFLRQDGTKPLTADWDAGAHTIAVQQVETDAIVDGPRELLTFVEDGAAVNHIEIENQATGSGPIIRAVGDDTDVDLSLAAKGDGSIFMSPLQVFGDIDLTGDVDGVDIAAHDSSTTAHGATGANVGTTNTQTLTNKTIDADNNTITNIGKTELEVPYTTEVKGFYIEAPIAGDAVFIGVVPHAVTAVDAKGETDTGTVTFNIEHRAVGSAFSAGTDILTSDLVATTSQATTQTFDSSGAVAADKYLYAVVTSVASSPTEFIGSIEYTIN